MAVPRRIRSPRGGAPPPTRSAEWVLAGRAWVRGRLQPVEIGIDADGWITEVARTVRAPHRHDGGDRVILPSATDLHVHFREPGGPPGLEGFASGTEQAALGGVGLVGEMPNTLPPVTSSERLEEKAALALGHLAVDLFLYGAATSERSIRDLARSAAALKIFLAPTTGLESPTDPAEIVGLLRAAGASGLPIAVHAEDPARFRVGARPSDSIGWSSARPIAAEESAVERLLESPTDALRLRVAHVTTAAIAERLLARGVAAEATPNHLLLEARAGDDARRKLNPPLRPAPERDALWEAFRAGRVPIVASDHAPHPDSEKARPFGDAPSGLPGVETMLPLLLERVRSGSLGLDVLVKAACERPARWIGVPMGRIAPGHRANLVLVDFRARRTVRARHLHAPCGWSPFEGWTAVFPTDHYREGRPVVEGGEFVGDRTGRLVRPEFLGAPA